MKNSITLSLLFVAMLVSAQTPQGLNYQAIYRNSQGNAISNQNVNVQFSILDGSVVGPAVYVENQIAQTNQFGLFNLIIGQGSPVSGSFSNINWSNNAKFLKVEVNNALLGTSKLMSVPYALYAEKTNLIAGSGISVNGNTVTNTSPNTDNQTLSLNGNMLSLSGGNSVVLPLGATSQWTSSGNNIFYKDGKVLIGIDSLVNQNSTTMLQVASESKEAALYISGNGGSNHSSIDLTELSTKSGWSINHKATINSGVNHQLMIDYLDAPKNEWNFNIFKLTPDGKTGLGFGYSETPPSKLSVKGGDVNVTDIGNGVIMKSPDGKCWRLTVSNSGQPVFTNIPCPQ